MKKTTALPEQTYSVIDETLTPENANLKGFHYIEDVFNPYAAILEVLTMAEEEGYRFGNPGKQNETDQHFGLYRPIKETNDSE